MMLNVRVIQSGALGAHHTTCNASRHAGRLMASRRNDLVAVEWRSRALLARGLRGLAKSATAESPGLWGEGRP
jgi:hypothetical protein